jgi:hypothetical protein
MDHCLHFGMIILAIKVRESIEIIFLKEIHDVLVCAWGGIVSK